MNASWLSASIGADAARVVGYLLAALAVLLALWLCFVVFRRRGGRVFGKSRHKDNHRISVRDSVVLDNRRRLVLIRRDNIEHLLLTGGDSDLVVETFADLSGSRKHEAEARPPDGRPDHAKSANNQGGVPTATRSQTADNAYMARPQPVPVTDNNERQRDFAAEKALARRVRRDMPPNPNRDARPDNSRQEAAMRPDEAERYGRVMRDMRAGPALTAEQAARHGNMAAFSAPRANNMPPVAPVMPHNGQNAAYPAGGRPAAPVDQEGGGHKDFTDMAENIQANGAFSPYPIQDDRQAALRDTMQRNGQSAAASTAMPPLRGNETAAMANGQGQNTLNGMPDAPIRPIMTESYAPYLGYMPRAAAQPPLSAGNMPNPVPRPDRMAQQSDRQDKSRDNVAAFEEIQGARPHYNSANSGNTARNIHSDRANADMRPPVMQAQRQNFQNREERNMSKDFDLAPLGSANGFAKITPPEENDFDKILQDELLRAPNGIKFSSSPKK
ncbi:MAG: hypothetical protein DU429_00215 [Candidatus Tokpelaia sp.]|nr:MAG: hypothetical protein DU430_04160 [Candidatus Tokpelaia sp.]KAA6207535.1 MAG: hypothetical protein DU429_00215 [Candidatus Tokpelaia sp.]